jgi:hypothetical protein
MSKLTLPIYVLLGFTAGLGLGYWLAVPEATGPKLPPSRSVSTLTDDFAAPGLTGEVRRVLLMPDLFERTGALAELLGRLGPESLEPVREAYDSVFLDLGETELVLFGEWWARFDPRSALAWTNFSWSTRGSLPVLKAIMRAWGRSDPMAAIAAATVAPNARMRRIWTDSALRGWDESVHDGALEYAESLGHGEARQWALYIVTRRKLLRDGPEAAIAWAEALPDDDETFKLNAFRRLAGGLAEIDPQLAVAFAERHLDGPYAKGLPRRIGIRWVVQDPEAAMHWLASLPPGPNRDDGVQETFGRWLGLSRSGAEEWYASVEREPWLDPAVSIYAKRLGREGEEPLEALRMAEQIEDPELRNPTLGVIARGWLVRDEAAANAWLEQSDLPPEYIARIRVIPGAKRPNKKSKEEN